MREIGGDGGEPKPSELGAAEISWSMSEKIHFFLKDILKGTLKGQEADNFGHFCTKETPFEIRK